MLIIEVQGNQVQFDVEQLIDRIVTICFDGNCKLLVWNKTMRDNDKDREESTLAVAYEIIEQFKLRKM